MVDPEQDRPARPLAVQIVAAHARALEQASDQRARGGVSDQRSAGILTGLSVDEWLMVDEAGYAPDGLFSGASVFHIGLVGSVGRLGNREIPALSQALLSARERAIANLAHQAQRAGVSGVIGVQLDIDAFEKRRHLVRVIAKGTGIRPRDSSSTHKAAEAPAPFVSALSGQEYALLLQAGYLPVGLAMGVCTYRVGRRSISEWKSALFRSTELSGYTTALYEARELAMTRLQAEAAGQKADGVVGVTTAEQSHVWGSRVIEFFAIGTSVRCTEAPTTIDPLCVLSTLDQTVGVDPTAIVASSRTRAARRSTSRGG